MKLLVRKIIDIVLSNQLVFQLQQQLCNNYETIRNEFQDYLNIENKRILDIGCSTGECARQIINMKQNDYLGIDIVEKYIAFAKKRCPCGKFMQLDIQEVSFEVNSFDLILLFGVLHHMDDELIYKMFSKIQRILADNGRVLVAEPVFSAGNLLSTILLSLDRGRHIRDQAEYRKLFDGFEVEKESYFPFSLHRFCSFVIRKGC